jgi:dihydroxyacid dehydratase/phosphogluconate dehydratase
MVYGGTIRAGSCDGMPQLDIVSAFQSYGQFLQDGKTLEAEKTRYNTVRHACPGPGACGGVSSQVVPILSMNAIIYARCTPQIPWPVLPRP